MKTRSQILKEISGGRTPNRVSTRRHSSVQVPDSRNNSAPKRVSSRRQSAIQVDDSRNNNTPKRTSVHDGYKPKKLFARRATLVAESSKNNFFFAILCIAHEFVSVCFILY